MKYQVILTPRADRDVDESVAFIYARSPHNAERWLDGLQDAIASLGRFPGRGGIAPESKYLKEELRHLIYKSHRIIYRVEAGIVRILYVRHAARRPVGDPKGPDES